MTHSSGAAYRTCWIDYAGKRGVEPAIVTSRIEIRL